MPFTVIAPEANPPFPVDAVVIEEDTGLVLSAEVAVDFGKDEHPIRVMTDLLDFETVSPGSIVVQEGVGQEGTPCKILAVIADFDVSPPVQEIWVRDALTSALRECDERILSRVAIQMLGTRYNASAESAFIEIYRDVTRELPLVHVRQVWLVKNPFP